MKLKKLLALILALAMVLSSVPLALAEEGEVPVDQPAPVEEPVEQPVEEPVEEPVSEDPLVIEEPEEEPVREVVVPKYKITFNSNGGSAVAQITDISEGSTVNKPTDPTKYGYEFNGWTGGFVFIEDATNENPATKIEADYELTAAWTAKSVNVSWSAGEASGSYAATPVWENKPEAADQDFATVIEAPASNPTLEGYNFAGWKYVGNNDETSATIGSEGPITVTAQWTIKKVKVTFDANMAGVDAPKALEDQDYGFVLPIPEALECEGQNFKGWTLNGEAYTAQAIEKDVQLVGSWEPVMLTVSFYKDQGDAEPYATKEVAWGGNVELPADPTDDGRTFSTWVLEDGTAFSVNNIKADVDVYAAWDVDTHQVTFNLDGGDADDKFAAQTVTYGGNATDPGTPAKFGYHFTGWKAGDADFTFDTAIEEDTELTAQWAGNAYTLEIDINGIVEDVMVGDDEIENPVSEIKVYSAETRFTVPQISAAGHEFNGYQYKYTDAEGKEQTVDVAVGQLELNANMPFVTTGTNAYKLVLTPVITKAWYDVTYNATGIVVPGAERLVYYPENDDQYSEDMLLLNGKDWPGTIKYEKYVEGWYTDAEFTTKWDFSKPVTSQMKLYAKLIDLCEVTFDLNANGKAAWAEAFEPVVMIPKGMSYAEFVEDGLPSASDIVYDKNTFDKWLYLGEEYDGTAAITTNITLVAQWVPTYHDVTIDPDNGDNPITGKVLDSESIADSENIEFDEDIDPEKDGCIFEGWFALDEDGEFEENKYDFDSEVTATITIKAKWTEAEVTDGDNLYRTLAEADDEEGAADEATLTLLKDVSTGEEGIAFSKSFTLDLNNKKLTGDVGAVEDKTLTLKNGTVDGSELSGTVVIQSGTYLGITLADGADVTIALAGGAKFDKDSVKAIAGESAFVNNGLYDYAIYAVEGDDYLFKTTATSSGYYVLVPYVTLTINLYEGADAIKLVVAQDDPTAYTHDFGTEEPSVDVPVREGYDFVKWTVEEEDFVWGTAVTEDTTITANWQAFVTVTFDWNDADNEPEITEFKVNDGDTVAKPEIDPELAGKEFEFWGTTSWKKWGEDGMEDADADEPGAFIYFKEYDFTSPVVAPLTLTAKWEWQVTFDPDNDKDDPTIVNVKNGAQVNASLVPNPTREDGSTFLGWYYVDEGGLGREYAFGDPIWGDAQIIAAWNNTEWQIESVYEGLAGGYTKTSSSALSYSGTEDEPIWINLVTDEYKPSNTLINGKYYIGYRFEAPNGITKENANLYSIWYDGAWHALNTAMDKDLSMAGHVVVSMFEEVSIDAMKQWADAGKPVVFEYKFAKTADKDKEEAVSTLTVSFDPNYVEFYGDEGRVYNITNYEYMYDVMFNHLDGDITVVDEETIQKESATSLTAGELIDAPESDGREFMYWTLDKPDTWPENDPEFGNFERDWAYDDDGAYREDYHRPKKFSEEIEGADGYPIWEDTTLYAYWHDVATVTLIVNGEPMVVDEDAMSKDFWKGIKPYAIQRYLNTLVTKHEKDVSHDWEYQTLNGFEENGDFMTWIDEDGHEIWDNTVYNDNWTLEEDLTLIAVFSDSTVTFDLNESEDEPAEWGELDLEIQVSTGSAVGDNKTYVVYTETNPEREGYKFMYWTLVEPDEDGNFINEEGTEPAAFDLVNDTVDQDITLYAYWRPAPVVGAPWMRAANMTFEGQIQMIVKFTLAEENELEDYEGWKVAFSNGVEVPFEEAELGDDGRYAFYCPVPIPEFDAPITITVLNAEGDAIEFTVGKDETLVESYDYNIPQYIVNKKDEIPGVGLLVQALDVYGQAAANRFLGGSYALDLSDVSLDDVTATETFGTKPEGVKVTQNVNFESDNSLNVKFTLPEGKTEEDYTFQIPNGAVKTVDGQLVKITVPNIAAPNLSNRYTFGISDGTNTFTITTSAMAYAKNIAGKSSSSAADVNLMKALYKYHLAAVDFFN